MAEPVPTGTMGKSPNLARNRSEKKEKKDVLHLMKS